LWHDWGVSGLEIADTDPAEPAWAGLAEQAELVASGAVSSAELVERALGRADRVQPTLGPFRVLRHEAARAEAAEADRRVAAGERLALLGVPVAIKDDTDLAGETTPFGCAGDCVPKSDDGEVVRRLRAAGAVILGKTTTSELGQWPNGETTEFGVTRNPWDPSRTPGGSSAGSAVAVATGIVPAAVGSDGAGSVRIPAAWTGLVGLKPQRGRISSWPDTDPFFGITTNGPLGRSVDDVALLLDVLTGNHPEDRFRPPPPDVPFRVAARREPPALRIALSFRTPYFVDEVLEPEIRTSVERLAEVLEGLGHRVFAAEPDYGLVGLSFLPRASAGSARWLERIPNPRPEPATVAEVRIGRALGGPVLRVARGLEPHYQRKVGRIFERADVVLTPTTARMPLPIGALDGLGWWARGQVVSASCPYCFVWNTLGWPALDVPAGLSRSGLPIGAQLLGRACDEATLLALATQLESVEHWADRRPPFPT